MKPKKPTPKIREVKIDAIIGKNKSDSSAPQAPKKRGRPRKSNGETNSQLSRVQNEGVPRDSAINGLHDEISAFADSGTQEQPEVVPIYDTTEEARAFIQTPFEVASGLTGIRELKLFPEELEAITPSFKVVYDKRIKPSLGENADLYAFGMVFAGIAAKKMQVFQDAQKKKKAVENFDSPISDQKQESHFPSVTV